MLQTDIRLKLKESVGARIELVTRDRDKVAGTVEWVSPDGQMAEIKLGNGEIKTICDSEVLSVKRL